jgi:hypothetical protein
VNGGYATAEMDLSINGSTLTAVLRNTSPDSENYLKDPDSLNSPAITGFGFDVRDLDGNAVKPPSSWQLTALDQNGQRVELGSSANRTPDNIWMITQQEDRMDFEISDRSTRYTDALYNPFATGGFGTSVVYFTEAVFSAMFITPVELIERRSMDFSPMVRFERVGWSSSPVTVSMPANSPEPASLVIWCLGVAAAVGFHYRKRYGRRETRVEF